MEEQSVHPIAPAPGSHLYIIYVNEFLESMVQKRQSQHESFRIARLPAGAKRPQRAKRAGEAKRARGSKTTHKTDSKTTHKTDSKTTH